MIKVTQSFQIKWTKVQLRHWSFSKGHVLCHRTRSLDAYSSSKHYTTRGQRSRSSTAGFESVSSTWGHGAKQNESKGGVRVSMERLPPFLVSSACCFFPSPLLPQAYFLLFFASPVALCRKSDFVQGEREGFANEIIMHRLTFALCCNMWTLLLIGSIFKRWLLLILVSSGRSLVAAKRGIIMQWYKLCKISMFALLRL